MTRKIPSHLARRFLFRAVALFVLIAWVLPLNAPAASAAPRTPPGYSDRILRLKLVEGATGDLSALLPADLLALTQKIDPLFTLPKSKLKELKAIGDERLKKEKGDSAPLLPDLSLWYEVRLVKTAKADKVLPLFQALPFVEIAGPAPLLTEPPVTPDFSGQQGYLDAAPGGVDAEYAWTIPGGNGAGITIYDIEYGWNQNHEDLSKIRNLRLLMNPGDSALISSADHGTAVLGEMIADNNGKGVTGIAWGANIGLAPANTLALGWNPANAILLAAANGEAGDVILVEQQTYVCNLNALGPSEWEPAVFQAIQTATWNGRVVVEAAGNGSVNLDQSACGARFNRTTRDSGAILVGAGRPPSSGYDRQRESFSTYGSRVDLQAWGSAIVTTGTGDLYGEEEWLDESQWYTNSFGGTSGAAPIVAAAAAVVQGIARERNGTPLAPWQVRDLLVQTGSPQLGYTGEHIGPRPNLHEAIAQLPQSATTLIVTGGSGNDGVCGVGDCTLSEAIDAANADPWLNFIELTAGAIYTLNAADNTDASYGANGLPVITSPVTINAHGAVIERSSAAGTPAFRLFQVGSGGTLTLNQITLRNGALPGGAGGAILNLGAATVSASTLTGNSAADGGAIANQGTLTLVSSTLANNNATVSGGAIEDTGTLAILSSTLAGNSAPTGANLATSGAPTLKNTILVKGANGANCAGALAAASIANLADDGTCGAATVGAADGIALGSLALNGGPTATMALGSSSAAIEAGNTAACVDMQINGRDQRGYNRFADANGDGIGRCDIGAYEYGSNELPPAPPGPQDTVPPAVSIIPTPASPNGANGWYTSAVSLDVQFSDAAGVIEVRCTLDPASPPAGYADLPEDTCPFVGSAPVMADGTHSLYAAAMDWYSNQSAPVSISFQLDATPPVITCPVAGPFLLRSGGHTVTVGPAGVADSISGLDEAASTLSGIVTTESIGPKTLTFTATDLAGNRTAQVCTYRVIFDFDGFYQGVLPPPVLNPVSAGSAIPLKFNLAGYQGPNVIAVGFPTSQEINCTTLDGIGAPAPTKMTNKSELTYDQGSKWYSYEWKTEKTWAGACRVLTIRLVDDTEHRAYFRF